jgi:pimeloyl-ACP methyl ester carboxylesterase
LDGFKFPEERAKSIKVPALIAAGTKTSVSIRESAKRLSELVPGIQFKMLEGQTHNVSEKAIAPVLIEFFKGN